MSRFQADQRLCLSQSFRFGPAIAAEANKWLQLLDAPLRLRGFDRIPSTVGPIACPDAVLCRTNAEAVRQLLVAPTPVVRSPWSAAGPRSAGWPRPP